MIKFVSYLWQVGGFFQVLWFLPPINWPPWYNWNIVDVALNTITLTPVPITSLKWVCTLLPTLNVKVSRILQRHQFVIIIQAFLPPIGLVVMCETDEKWLEVVINTNQPKDIDIICLFEWKRICVSLVYWCWRCNYQKREG
jgi:hypothetical protein